MECLQAVTSRAHLSLGVGCKRSHFTLANEHLLGDVTSVETHTTSLILLPDCCPQHFIGQHLLSVGRKEAECLKDEGKVGN